MKNPAYGLYNRIGMAISQAGISRLLGPGARTYLARGDVFLRQRISAKLSSPAVIQDFLLHFPEDGLFAVELAQSRTIEPRTTQIFRTLLQPGMTFVDVGAHIGWYALNAASIFQGHGSVYAFEPDPVLFQLLQTNIVANQALATITPIQKAVSSQVGVAKFYSGSRDRQTNSLVPSAGTSNRSFECSVTSLDAFFKGKGWPPINVIKIDVEGAEHSVLRGMTELCARNRALKLIIEFHPGNILTQHSVEDYFNALHALGFGKISMIFDDLIELDIPQDLPRLLERCTPGPFVNLLCERRL